MCSTDVIWYYMDGYWDEIADPRPNHWFIINGGIWKILTVMTIYLIVTRIILPAHMKNRPPYKLKRIILAYNSLMVFINAFLLYCFVIGVEKGRIFFDFKYPTHDDYSENTLWLMNMGWYWFLSRFLDLMDTVFFVLRKKESQVTYLHLYHHTVVPILGWLGFKYNFMVPIIRLFLVINAFIHVMMYGYYALSSLGERVQKYLWWKKYITIVQIIQFAICGVYGVILYVMQTDYPIEFFILFVGQNPLFFLMFYDFYKKSYKTPKGVSKNKFS